MDYLRLLVKRGLVANEAIDIAQAQRDPAEYGIKLRAVEQRAAGQRRP